MMGAGDIKQFQWRWQQSKYVEAVLYAVGFGGFVYLLTNQVLYGIIVLLVTVAVAVLILRPWRITVDNAVGYIDAHLPEAGYSSGLLLLASGELSNLSKLQQYRVSEQLEPILPKLRPPHKLFRAALVMFAMVLVGIAGRWALQGMGDSAELDKSNKESISFEPKDSLLNTAAIPTLTRTMITIQYPGYTGQGTLRTTDPNLRAVQGSTIIWDLEFDGGVQDVKMDLMGEPIAFTNSGQGHRLKMDLGASGFYSFVFTDREGHEHVSDLYSLEMVTDEPPLVQIEGLDNYSYFEFDQDKRMVFNTDISDDFGIADAYIIATVSKGSGESVKFREEKVAFDASIGKGSRILQLKQALDLDELKMDPGDELYFYVEALDQRTPSANVARSETFFAVIRDTITDPFAVEGNLGVDLMPDYFRSQRQLIIDTEKLLAERPDITDKEFNSRSNELGFDQKQLRLKYGQFMGDETELQAAPGQVSSNQEGNDGHSGEDAEEDLLDGYSHKHDSDNEHNLVEEHDHGNEDQEEEEDPLHDYLHNHSDPEESTLFEKSLKAKLRDALNIMWEAELYLRLFEPEKSLPYQYQALDIIQEIKNSARIYVHRIGFDPPPIKEENRLSGDIEKITNYSKNETYAYQGSFASARKVVSRLEILIDGNSSFSNADQNLIRDAGNELAQRAVLEPLKYLKVLQGLRDLEKSVNRTTEKFTAVRKDLLSVLPSIKSNPMKNAGQKNEMDLLFLKELGVYEQ
ncbi:tryptophan-rich sensory protein [Flagellimonas okinawensis]|uniref:Tryptophan-rich sensory protein n=1 Tax=Flagellimonas okinawensis TaxID=3031324 RepID=A0ABT5XTF0_9FLAO|nr:tryptophan-rich sensory protein [[Muricauda] okinawensis]MDF0709165.1 tryptophan-rich sensory protein [[Muricauda] okinawensis]